MTQHKSVEAVLSAAEQSDGWIEWAGGECPVADGVLVEIKGRDGDVDTGYADDWAWDWMPTWPESDIIAYRLVKP